MIKIENAETFGWESAIRGMRNPMNSWEKSDTWYGCRIGDYGRTESHSCTENCKCDCTVCVGANDMKLMKNLVAAGTDHAKFLRMIVVSLDITAPLYWWKEYDTYKVGTVRNSCSTMHKIMAKEFTIDDFSYEHLIDTGENLIEGNSLEILKLMIKSLNYWRKGYLQNNDKEKWWQVVQLLPSSYNQRATVLLNYAVLRNVYHSRWCHKLDEWRQFCDWIETLPYAEELIMCK